MRRGQAILVDTNIIIEAVRTNCWGALTAHFSIETVETCCEEARSGERHRPGYVVVEEKALREGLKVHRIAESDLVALGLRDPESKRLDPGERHLWAHALARGDAWAACCCDNAAVRSAVRLGWEDRLMSLEELVRAAGAIAALGKLKDQFGTDRLSLWRTQAILARGLG